MSLIDSPKVIVLHFCFSYMFVLKYVKFCVTGTRLQNCKISKKGPDMWLNPENYTLDRR